MGCLIRPITAHFPIKAANFEPWSIFAQDVVRMADICVAFQRVSRLPKSSILILFSDKLWNISWRKRWTSSLINVTFQRIYGRYRQEAVKYLYVKKSMDMFVRGHSFAWLVSIKCWKPAESLLEMIGKRQNTSVQLIVSFHWVCETVTIICWNPHGETIVYFTVKKMKCS